MKKPASRHCGAGFLVVEGDQRVPKMLSTRRPKKPFCVEAVRGVAEAVG